MAIASSSGVMAGGLSIELTLCEQGTYFLADTNALDQVFATLFPVSVREPTLLRLIKGVEPGIKTATEPTPRKKK
jgi:hypothetical protein